MKHNMADLSNKLKEIREYLNLSQQFVSEKTGIPRTAISSLECRKRKISSIELVNLAKLYNYPVSYFLGEQEGSSDETLTRLYRAAGGLEESDRQELVRFAEFLRHSGTQRRNAYKVEDET